ncbi:MAG: 1-acyl-sn-glycerol-3-phosphate acyltransferase, partial [Pararhodobacter sp.]
GLGDILWVQPVTLVYTAPPGRDARFYGWFGKLGFGGHFLRVVSQVRQGRVAVVFHEPVRIAEAGSRKELARQCETAVRTGLVDGLPEGVVRG